MIIQDTSNARKANKNLRGNWGQPMWQFIVAASAALLTFAWSWDAYAQGASCTRHTVQFQDLPQELTKQISNCPPAFHCPSTKAGHLTIGQVEKKTIAAWAPIAQWIAQAPSATTPSSVAQQNSLMTTTRNLANANRPVGKFVYRINFFLDSILGYADRFLGADIYYAKCVYLWK